MNYIKEVNAFYDWLETNSMAVSSIALWHALLHICNKAGWPKEFTVAILILSAKTGLERRTIYNARNELKQKGRIDFKERKGNQSAIYSIIWFCEYGEYENSGTKFAHKVSRNDTYSDSRNSSYNVAHNAARNVSGKRSPNPARKVSLVNNDLTKIHSLNQMKRNEMNARTPDIEKLKEKHATLFQAKFGSLPVIDESKDDETLSNLLNVHDILLLTQLLEDFFQSTDPFIMKSGYSIGVFWSQINKLLVMRLESQRELENINMEEYPGGPNCKCGGKGWYTIFDPTANNGIGANRSLTCPCLKLKKYQQRGE